MLHGVAELLLLSPTIRKTLRYESIFLVAILLKDLIIKQCFFNYMCCMAVNGRLLYDGLERRYKKAAVACYKATVWYLPGRCKGKQHQSGYLDS
jgi:hypothetical protein